MAHLKKEFPKSVQKKFLFIALLLLRQRLVSANFALYLSPSKTFFPFFLFCFSTQIEMLNDDKEPRTNVSFF